MKKKLLAVLLTGVMAASFAGTATVVSADSGDDNTLTVWAWDQNFNIKSMQIAADQYAADHEGFSVDIIETSSDDCQTKLTTAANAGDYSTLPDIVLMQDTIGDDVKWLVEGVQYNILFVDGNPVSIELPNNMEIKVAEAAEGLRGDTSSAPTKWTLLPDMRS